MAIPQKKLTRQHVPGQYQSNLIKQRFGMFSRCSNKTSGVRIESCGSGSIVTNLSAALWSLCMAWTLGVSIFITDLALEGRIGKYSFHTWRCKSCRPELDMIYSPCQAIPTPCFLTAPMSPLLSAFTAVLCLSTLSPVFGTVAPSFPYGSKKVRGVNLGGWLVLEVGSLFCACRLQSSLRQFL
jgi:hypothetical protein